MVSQRRVAVITFALSTAVIAACAKKPPPAPAPVVPAVDSAAIRDSIERARLARLRQDSINAAEAMRRQRTADSIANANRMAAEAAAAAEREAAAMRSTITTGINYDFDK